MMPLHLQFVLSQTLSYPVVFCVHIASGIEVLFLISQMGKLMERSGDSGHRLLTSYSLAMHEVNWLGALDQGSPWWGGRVFNDLGWASSQREAHTVKRWLGCLQHLMSTPTPSPF